jgi:hypothetical protein
MNISLIDSETHKELSDLYTDNPELHLQNNGYEYLSKDVREAKAPEIKRISDILREHVKGFVKFFNFRVRKSGEIVLRFDYVWDDNIGFVGVGYVELDELRHGFKKEAQA